MNLVPRAVAGALVLAVPVTAQAVSPASFDTVSWELAFAVSQLVGWCLLLTVALAVRPLSTWGSRLLAAGCLLQLVFALGYAAAMATSGEPADWAFLPFLLGFVCLTAGCVTTVLAARRVPGARLAMTGAALVGGLGLAAVVVGVDPWHDLALVGSYLAWPVLAADRSLERDGIREGLTRSTARPPATTERA